MTEEEVIEGFREAGLPLELLDSMSVHDALMLTSEEYGENPYDDPEANRTVAVHVPHGEHLSKDKKAGPGRPAGSVNKMTREMREAVLAAADELGHIPFKDWKQEINKRSDDGIKQFYKVLAVKELRTFGVILARMLPTNVTHTTVAKLPTFMTEEEVIEGFREAGLPLELLDSLSVHDAWTLTPEEYGENPYDDPEADPIDVVPEGKKDD